MEVAAVERRLDMGYGEIGIHTRDVKQCLGLKVEYRWILGGIRDLEHPIGPVARAQPEVLVSLAIQRMRRRADAEDTLGDIFRLRGRERRGLGLQDVPRRGVGGAGNRAQGLGPDAD